MKSPAPPVFYRTGIVHSGFHLDLDPELGSIIIIKEPKAEGT
jgi:hypothetical protein